MKKLKYQNLSKDAERVFLQVEDEILMNAAKKLGMDKSLLTEEGITSWQANKLNQLGQLDRDNLKILAKYSNIELEEMEKMLEEVGYVAVDEIEGDMKKGADKGILLNPPDIEDSESLIQVLNAHKDEAKKRINNINNTMLSQANVKYTQVVNDATGQVVAGIKTPHQALRQVAREWAETGIPAMVDSLGRQWSTEAYVSMVTRTSANNIANGMQDERMKEYGNDLIEVSSHAGARPHCEPWQGRIYSLSGNNKNYEAFSNTSYGLASGLFGINCGHFKYPYIPGISEQTYYPYDKEENDRIYKESQKQRYHERQIRSAKNEMNMMKGIGDEEGFEQAKTKLRNRQANLREFIDDTGRTRRRDREQLAINNPR